MRLAVFALTCAVICSGGTPAWAADEEELLKLIDQLGDPEKASAAADSLVEIGEDAVPDLLGEALEAERLESPPQQPNANAAEPAPGLATGEDDTRPPNAAFAREDAPKARPVREANGRRAQSSLGDGRRM